MAATEPTKRPRGNTTGRGAVAARVQDILPLVSAGAPFRDLQQFVNERTAWGPTVCERTLHNYLRRGADLIAKEAEGSAQWHIALALERYQRLFWRGVEP
jgi:hypothetical protein